MFAFFNRHTARLCQLTLAAPLFVLALASGCDQVLSIEKPVRASSGAIGGADSGVVPERPGPAPDDDAGATMDDGATMTCSEEMECCPNCAGATCGSDGCGGSCGVCNDGTVCTKDRTCSCVSDCEGDGKVCGSDGCDGTCGTCDVGHECSEDGKECTCVRQCGDRRCGPDGCGGSCGECTDGLTCDTRAGRCEAVCAPDCAGRECGSDGCGEGTCGGGECGAGETCNAMGRCACVPNCVGRACGPDGCGGSCGVCRDGRSCSEAGQCICEPKTACDDDQCGSIDDGCGGTVACDRCPRRQSCYMGACCTPMVCGERCGSISDRCGGTINCPCEPGYMCNSAHTCVVMTPPPLCTGASVEFCDELPKLPVAAPLIDGVSDCGAPLQAITPVGWTESVGAIPPGVAARYAAAWLETGLYLYVEVDVPTGTPNPSAIAVPYYCGDSVEIDAVLDGGGLGNYYRVPGGGQTVVRSPDSGVVGNTAQAYAHTGRGRYAEPRAWTDASTIGAFPRAGGYTIEALITGEAVGDWEGSLSAGQRVGFDIGINVAAPPGTPAEQIDGSSEGCPMLGERLGQFYLRTAARSVPDCSSNGDPWCTPSALCNPELR